ncbi:MAG: lactococcin 972 family bacteriocin [Salinibacterium sp.]|nr:lactococcin 972 family bacteriocin [Salinibacterium sp.]
MKVGKKLVGVGVAAAALVLLPVAGALATTVNVGGGLWSYGTTIDTVYSNYHHGSLYHSATACHSGWVDRCHQASASAGAWANASNAKSPWGGNTAYWNTY